MKANCRPKLLSHRKLNKSIYRERERVHVPKSLINRNCFNLTNDLKFKFESYYKYNYVKYF